MNRFGNIPSSQIYQEIERRKSLNTRRCQQSIWRQFLAFCKEKKYKLTASTPVQELAAVLCDYGYNMKKSNGESYKEYTVKTIWNGTAKILQEKYYKEYGVKFNPFEDIEFKTAREAKNALRKTLQSCAEKRKCTEISKSEQIYQIIEHCDENTPDGLQIKFFHVASYYLAWRSSEAAQCMMYHFKEEVENDGTLSNKIIYNPTFTKICQVGDITCAKWLTSVSGIADRCPVRLYRKLIEKRTANINTDRFFLTPNPYWTRNEAPWYKNTPVGRNEISKWNKLDAMGLEARSRRIVDHSGRVPIAPQVEFVGVAGPSGSSSARPFLRINEEDHDLSDANEQYSNVMSLQEELEVKPSLLSPVDELGVEQTEYSEDDYSTAPSTSTTQEMSPVPVKIECDEMGLARTEQSIHSISRQSEKNRFEVFGDYVAMKLQTASQDQQALAEKLINEVLFEAQMGNLNRWCKLMLNNDKSWHN